MKNLVALVLVISCLISSDLKAQPSCASYTTWTGGMWIGPGSHCGSPYGGTTVTSGDRLYTHRGYCSSTGPGSWDFQDIGACTSCTDRTVGAASSSPSVCINVAITPITHNTTQVTGIASSSGLPAGVTAAYSGNVITISGTPTASGVFNYTITPTSGCGSATATGTITVTALPTITGTTPASVCGSGTLALSATASAGTISWWAASTGGAALATGTSYTTPNISTTTTYYVSATSGTCTSASRTAIAATVTSTLPTITGTTPASRCGAGTVALSATASAGTISWWAASTGGVALATGTSYTTPSISSTTTYYVSTTSGTCTSASRTAIAATVTEAATAGAASSTPTLCVNAALTNITHTTTVATGIGTATGLPAGVTAAWASNTITISGTPTASGTFNYTIPLTGGSCAVNATGTITVTSTAWAPTDLGASLALWLDANDAATITQSGGLVSQWNDKSGNNRHATQATSGSRPTYTASGLNGKSVLTLDGTDDNMSISAPFANNAGTALIVYKPNSDNIYCLFTGDNDSWSIWNGNNSSYESTFRSVRLEGATNQLSINDANIFMIEASSVLPSYKMFKDGSTIYSSAAAFTFQNNINSLTVNRFLNGFVSEVILIDKVLTLSDREKLEGYLAWKWGLQANLPAGHTYKSAAPTTVATAGAASSTPTLCQNTALTNITHTTTVATGIGTATGLPAGVTAAWASNTITISGTPSQSGTFNYTIPLTIGCGTVNATGTITVGSPANTAGAASSTPTLCVNSALTNITHTTTGATGIGTATGLPAGVTAAWASNTITISGTPTASGTFNYTIPLTGGCGSVNATGTITVTSTAWTPATLGASLAMWYDASDASSITHSSGVVSQWNDKSGNARHLAESNNTYKPTYTANILNGYGGINFYLNKGLFSTANPVVGYVATIIKAQNTTWNNYHVMLESRTNATRIGGLWSNGGNTFWMDVYPSLAWQDGTSMSVSGAFSTINTPHIIEYTPSAGRGNPMSGITVGNFDQTNQGGSGIQYEIIALSAAPSQADREKIEGYLAHKWGLQANLPAGHTYKSAAPTIVATAGAASSTPTLCQNTALTNITHTTTVATGIGTATGLPAGVTAAWASNTITISGTPSQSGTFNYTIPLTIGCGTVNATGTITVRSSSSGPGGVTDQLSVWLKADAGVSSIGTSWQDQGCSANNYATVSGPTVISNDINSNPAVEILSGGFNGPAGAAIGTSWTVFSVHRFLSSDYDGRLIDGHSGNYLLGNWSTYSKGIFLEGNPGEYQSGIATTTGTQTTRIYCFSRDNSSGSITARVDGDLLKTFTSTNTASGIIWDLNQGAYANEPSDARMGEFIVFNKALSATEILKVEAYLAAKYGLTLSNADGGTGGDFVSTGGTTYWDASASAAYSNEIVVIGKDNNTALTQKQSKSSDDSLRVYVGSFAAANTSNAATITNDQSYLVLGHNNGKLKANYLSSLEKPAGITSRFQREWKVVNTNFADNFTLRVKYDSSTAITLSHLRLLVDDDGNFSNATVYGTSDGLTFSHGSIIVSGISTSMIPLGSTKYITIGSTSTSTTLPVNLLSFDAVLQDGFVELSWQTASEINNDHFVVERSDDGVNWTSFAKVKGAGYSNSTLSYFQADVANFSGVRYYRLTQVDFDGTQEIFKIVSVSKSSNLTFTVMPNPMVDEVIVQYSANSNGNYRFKILSETGQELYSAIAATVEGENSFKFNTSWLASGTYIFSIENESGFRTTQKVVK